MLALANGNAAGQSSLVVSDTVVGDLEVVGPSVNVDAAATLRAVGHGEAINPRRVAVEVTGERVAVCVIRVVASQEGRAGGESISIELRIVVRESHALRQDG